MLPYREVLEGTSCEFIEATAMRQTLLRAGHVVSMHDERLPNTVTRGVMVGGRDEAGPHARRLQYSTVLPETVPVSDSTRHRIRRFPRCFRIILDREGKG